MVGAFNDVSALSWSFDPVTYGHCDILRRAFDLFEDVIVGVAVNPAKSSLFSQLERQEMMREVIASMGEPSSSHTGVIAFDTLAIDAARAVGVTALIRGVRDTADLDYEMQIARRNVKRAPGIRTIFLPASPSMRTVSSTLVREIARMGGNVDLFVPAVVARKLTQKLAS